METRFIVGLAVGIFIYIAAVSGLYLVFKDDIAYQKKQLKKVKEKRKKAKELMKMAKTLQSTQSNEELPKENSSEVLNEDSAENTEKEK